MNLIDLYADKQAQRDTKWSYTEAFSRNLGLISRVEQQRLRGCKVAIPGMGGVGGNHLMTLTRLGIEKFRIADADKFETKNFNRQFGATLDGVGRRKVEVMDAAARCVNPRIRIETWGECITVEDVSSFLDGVDLLVDSIDFFAFEARRLLFSEARKRGIWAITAGPIGFSTAWVVFDPKGMSFDEYFDLHDGMKPVDKLCAFALGLAPRSTHLPYFDFSYIKSNGKAPSVSSACQLATGVVGAEAIKILLGRGSVRSAPYCHQFDPYRYLLRTCRLPWGNRGPLQRIKRRMMRRKMIELGYE